MLAANSSYGRRSRFIGTPTTPNSIVTPRPRLPLRNYFKSKGNFFNYADTTDFSRMKRLKGRKINGTQKMDLMKKKPMDYTEMAYREAVSKLKYLLAESYAPRQTTGKLQESRNIYQTSNPRINESGEEDTDDRTKMASPSKAYYSNLALSAADLQSAPPELTSFIERQEEYIEQLERESQFCRDELTNLLRKVREVVAENEALHSKNKSGFFKCALEEHKHFDEDSDEYNKRSSTQAGTPEMKKHRVLEGPSIVFESRISELEAQLTQAKLELRKAQEENQANLKRISENSSYNGEQCEMKVQLEQALRGKCDAEIKLENLQKSLTAVRDNESEALQKAKRSVDSMQQLEFEKNQCEAEVRRLKEELYRQHEKLREAAQEANKRITEERQQAERRYSQQVEQLSADITSHWDAANKSQLEADKQRRELTELRRELSQKQAFIDNLKKELQNKISSLQSEVNQATSEKDAAEQEILATKLAAERNERQSRQEQSRLQTEINSYKQRLERADADLVHCRRENLRLSEQIGSLEKEISMSKAIRSEDSRAQSQSKLEDEKDLTSMIVDMETKHAATVAGLEDALNNQATLVSRLTAECQSLTQRLEANDLKHKEEMASVQINLEYLSNKIQACTSDKQKATAGVEDRDESTTIYNSNGSSNPQMPVHCDEDASRSQIAHEDYNITTNSERNNHYNREQVHATEKLQMDSNEATQAYQQGNENQSNEREYTTDDPSLLQSYVTDQQYNQYEQYNPTEYQEEYMDENQYISKEAHEESQLSTEARQNNSHAGNLDVESMH